MPVEFSDELKQAIDDRRVHVDCDSMVAILTTRVIDDCAEAATEEFQWKARAMQELLGKGFQVLEDRTSDGKIRRTGKRWQT